MPLRLEHRLSRVAVVERTGINWKRIRNIEEGSTVACLDELVQLASLFSVHQAHSGDHVVSKRGNAQGSRRSASESAKQEVKHFLEQQFLYSAYRPRGQFREPPSADIASTLGGRDQSIAAKISVASACSAANSLKKWKWSPNTSSSEYRNDR